MLLLRISFIILLPCYFQMKSESLQSGSCTTKDKNVFATMKCSFKTFYSKVQNFFGKQFLRLENMRRKIKNAFYRFIDESKPNSCLDPVHTSVNANRVEDSKDLVPDMPILKLIASQNYWMETHTILTKDGYMITVHRMLTRSSTIPKKIVLLFHGLWGSTMDWIILGPKKGLPYLLLKSGYDVWLANARGNEYSNSHVSKATDSAEYWNFSWHEIGLYDMSSILDYMVEITLGKSKIVIVAYSMGATALLVLLSISPQYNSIIKSAILLAPLVYMNHVEGPIQYLANIYVEDDLSFLSNDSLSELIPGGTFPDSVKEKFCKSDKMLCSNILLLLGNGGKEMSNTEVMTEILRYIPAGGSKKTIIHYLQLIRSKRFQMFDYGPANIVIYGTESPKSYQLSKISVPIVVINSIDDWLSNVKDVANLLTLIPSVNHTEIQRKDFSHLDFLWANDAARLVYSPILDYLHKIF